MKKLLNTLFVTTQGSYLAKEGETIVVKVDREVKLRLPVHGIGGIVCFGQVSCSPQLMGFCGDRGVLISFLSENGYFLARVQGPVSGNVLLRREQYRIADDLFESAKIARAMVLGKIGNSRTVLLRFCRDHSESASIAEVQKAIRDLTGIINETKSVENLEILRGKEGDAARIYFSVFNNLITADKENFYFKTRSRRPPLDNVNSLLSFLYTIIVHDVTSALESVGLDPAVGFLHRDRPGRPGLALDIMEELRAFLGDRLVLSLINLKQVQAKGLKKTETGAVMMDDETRKLVLVAYQTRKQEEITHPFINEKISIGMLFFIQALLLARYLRGDIDGYPAFLWK